MDLEQSYKVLKLSIFLFIFFLILSDIIYNTHHTYNRKIQYECCSSRNRNYFYIK